MYPAAVLAGFDRHVTKGEERTLRTRLVGRSRRRVRQGIFTLVSDSRHIRRHLILNVLIASVTVRLRHAAGQLAVKRGLACLGSIRRYRADAISS